MCAIVFLATLLLSPNTAFCRISADAELGYTNYDLKNNSNQHLTASSFYQRYSILYSKRGNILNERFARYDVSVGYEWSGFNSSFKSGTSENIDEGKGKIKYSGDLTVDPREIPFRLHLYSHDTGGSSFYMGNRFNSVLLNNQQIRSDITSLSPNINIPMGITSGQHISSGATLVMGVKNGMTNGYNEILRHFPMLMLDYSDRINVDNNYNGFREDNRLSRLAFVSLNKKDNWFHYRYTTYKDNIDPGNNYLEKQIQIGTVDHQLQRRWIDFSNWLQVSADGQLTRRTSAVATDSFDEINLNLFGSARRSTWEARMFNSFNRYKDSDNLITYKTSIPVYASGIYGPNIHWDAFAAYRDNVTTKGEQYTSTTGGYRLDTFKRSPFNLTQSFSIDHSNQSNGNTSLGLGGSLGTNSTKRFSNSVSLSGLYSMNHFVYHSPDMYDSTFTTHNLNVRAAYFASNTFTVTFNQSNTITNGKSQNISSGITGVITNSPQYFNPRNGSTDITSSYRSVTNLSASWNPKPRLFLTLSITEDIFKQKESGRSDVTSVESQIKYSTQSLTLSSVNKYANTSSRELNNQSNSISSENTASYIHSRNLDSRVAISYYRPFESNGASDTLNLYQSLNYYHYKVNGMQRRLFEINESFESVGSMNNWGDLRRNYFTLGVKYYPIRQLQLSSSATYLFVDKIDNYQMSYHASVAANFSLLSASLDYSYGKSKADGRTEKIFSANLRKRF